MKKLLGIIIFFLLWNSLYSQIYLPTVPNDYGTQYNRLRAITTLHLPLLTDTTSTHTTAQFPQIGVYNGKVYWNDGKGGYWLSVGGANQNLQQVTTAGNTTTLQIKALNFDVSHSQIITQFGTSLISHDTVKHNLAIGYRTLANGTTGQYANGIGDSALYSNTTGSGTAMGYGAMKSNTTGSNNVAFGYQAMYSNQTGTQNTAIGSQSLWNTTGGSNTGVGVFSLYYNTSGANNTAVGNSALLSNTTGTLNTAVGAASLNKNTIGTNNSAFGVNAYTNQVSGNDNTAIGDHAMYGVANGVAWANVSVGKNSMYNVNQVVGNTGIGRSTLYNLSNGNYNTALGDSAGYNITTGSNNIAIGKYTSVASGTSDNQMNIGYMLYSRDGTKVGVFNNLPTYELDVTGRGRFSDTLFGKTLGIADSSLGVATTAWVKQQGFGASSIPTLQQVVGAGNQSNVPITLTNAVSLTFTNTTTNSRTDLYGNDDGNSSSFTLPDSSGYGTISASYLGNKVFASQSGDIPLNAIPGIGNTNSVKYTDTSAMLNPYQRKVKRTTSISSSSTPTPNATTDDMFVVSALATTATFGSPGNGLFDGQELTIRVKDNGTAQGMSWNAIYRASPDSPLPLSTTAGKTCYINFHYNQTDGRWDETGVINNY